MDQQQFLDVIPRDEAERRFQSALRLQPLGHESVSLSAALGRILAEDVLATVDVPSFDRSNVDGFAVRARDTYGAGEERPRRLLLLPEIATTGVVPQSAVGSGQALAIATGGMLPRGADAVVMVEHAEVADQQLVVRRPLSAGTNVAYAGTDIGAGETVLRRGERLTSRETGVLAAIGVTSVAVWRRPRVAIVSTGDEIIAPGTPMRPGLVYDSNARIIADAVRELGGEPVELGVVRDDFAQLTALVHAALAQCDGVLLSGGTSKGQGDLSYQVARQLRDPGIVAHGVALKPGKPICLAVTGGKPVVILPGFPTSAIFTFHEFVAPVLRRLAGLPAAAPSQVRARLATKVLSEVGRTEYLLVGLVAGTESADRAVGGSRPAAPGEGLGANLATLPLVAYPMGKGSGSVTTFSRADGFVTIPRHQELVEAGTDVDVSLLGRDLRPADLVVIGSHCLGLDYLLGRLQDQGYQTKFLAVGSLGGLEAARRGECDVAGIHLLDPESGTYNVPFLTSELDLVPGYGRAQGIVFRAGDPRFTDRGWEEVIAWIRHEASHPATTTGQGECRMVNRNPGSGTRILIDRLLQGVEPPGYAVQPRNHNAVAAAVAQGRADWGITTQHLATRAGLGFLAVADEQFDFVVPRARRTRPAVRAFCELVVCESAGLMALGLRPRADERYNQPGSAWKSGTDRESRADREP
ncbi:MAG: molybdopterin biosynthesis protein [Pirellulales bacterium]